MKALDASWHCMASSFNPGVPWELFAQYNYETNAIIASFSFVSCQLSRS